ncbi:tigger transposable element-derived protein 4-like [Hyalella azteca]|uniref:Tigger transposable element-derived protein 4-like n=1 Tax=Hyalella azteca TaxID=294128 RepID=A0A8B7NN95_HYAAZ|nr:tigger transposable element-derived protein 4-like [Hyalella azteca]
MYHCSEDAVTTKSSVLYDAVTFECPSIISNDDITSPVHLSACDASESSSSVHLKNDVVYRVLDGTSLQDVNGSNQNLLDESVLQDVNSTGTFAVRLDSVNIDTDVVMSSTSEPQAGNSAEINEDDTYLHPAGARDDFIADGRSEKRRKRLTLKGKTYANERSSLQRRCNVEVNFPMDDEFKDGVYKQRRCRLTLEVKVDIVKRVMAGEKQRSLAEEYNLNFNTVKTIVKNSSKYLQCWNEGTFTPGTKRLKGAKREDLERVLCHWYHKMIASNSGPVTGSQLCSKAMDIAARLGHSDFKASHGWLDRFKKRNNIAFNKASMIKESSDQATAGDLNLQPETFPLGDALIYHDPCNVFTLQEVGIFYKALPRYAPSLSGNRCAGGLKSSERFTVLLCANAIGSEKFPLLVVGAIPKIQYRQLVPDSPVQYIYDPDSWLTKESVFAWLLDLDDWFSQHRRKVLMIVSDLPVQQGNMRHKFNSLVVYQLRPPSTLPLRSNVVPTFKLLYRQGLLSELLKDKEKVNELCSEDRNSIKLPLSVHISLLGKAWEGICNREIIEGFHKTGLNRYSGWLPNHVSENVVKLVPELLEEYRKLDHVPNGFSMDNYVNFDALLQVCDELTVDDMIAQVLIGKESRDEVEVSQVESDHELERHLAVVHEYVSRVGDSDLSSLFQRFQELLKQVPDTQL